MSRQDAARAMPRMALKVAACVLVCGLCAPNRPAAQEARAGGKTDLANARVLLVGVAR
jgi:hypothetical protein